MNYYIKEPQHGGFWKHFGKSGHQNARLVWKSRGGRPPACEACSVEAQSKVDAPGAPSLSLHTLSPPTTTTNIVGKPN